MADSNITVSKDIIESTSGPSRYNLRVWVQSTTNNIPGEVFVYQHIPAVPDYNEGEPEDRFVHMASYADMVAFPKEAPSIENPYFRLHYMSIVHDSRSFLEEKWEIMSQQLNILIKDITRVNQLPPGVLEEVPVTGACV